MATITCLPQEVITIILGYNDISVEDIINFKCVCKQFRWAAKYNKYMEKKFSQRWPSAKKLYDKQCKENEHEKSKENEQKNKTSSNFMETGTNCTKELRNYVSQILHEHYNNNEIIDNLTKFHRIFHLEHLQNNLNKVCEPENFIKYSFFIDEIKNLLIQSPRRTGCDLTERYCNIKMFHYMRHCLVRNKLYRYTNQSYKNQLLERIVTMAAQLLQPEKDVFYSSIKTSLDSIALEVLDYLREKHPNHSIFSMSAEIFSYWENNHIDNNQWNEAGGTQIMDILEEYILGKFQLCKWGMSSNTKLEYWCIDNVLKNRYGQELILLIIYHSVARRLGLRCDVIRFGFPTSHFFIVWKPNFATYSSRNTRCFNISSKKFLSYYLVVRELLHRIHSNIGNFDGLLRARRFWQQLVLLALEDSKQYNNAFTPYGLIPVIVYDSINVFSLRVKKAELYTRPEDVKFAVGMIVTHQPTDCAGVIVGWHRHLDRHLVTFSAKSVPGSDMHIYELPLNHSRNCNFIEKQTNYIILTENNKMYYVEEDAITLTTPRWIDNSEIGRYFYKFEGTHYVPNKMLAKLYPQDTAITAQHHCSNIATLQ
ncbi:uncharacterized protein LOC115238564 [Formica exsecta]|uniref:uncharacterized protein LOC115238564 n=1 Tax=Formica exsecta TaxID=72781 RepID=UPI0011439B0C|nr:uncharacterized protein LOC115238564 [Formica exsecta]